MERHNSVGGVAGTDGWMPSGVADADAINDQTGWPDRRKGFERQVEHRGGRNKLIAILPRQMIGEMTCSPVCAEQIRPHFERVPQAVKQCRAVIKAYQWIVGANLKILR